MSRVSFFLFAVLFIAVLLLDIHSVDAARQKNTNHISLDVKKSSAGANIMHQDAHVDSDTPSAIVSTIHTTTKKPAVPKARIVFAGHKKAHLFVNGRHQLSVSGWSHVGQVYKELKPGDVVAIYVVARGNEKMGLIADVILPNNRHYPTGTPAWKAIPFRRNTWKHTEDWTTPRGSSCNWQLPVQRPMRPFHRKALKSFPSKARPVWTRRTGGRKMVLFRYVVGGERCLEPTRIYVYARSTTWIYVNGRVIARIPAGRRKALNHALHKGDVVGARSNARRTRGVLIDVKGPFGHAYTGGPGWRARSGWPGRKSLTRRADACSWNAPRLLARIRERAAPQASLVWTGKRYGNQRSVLTLRYTVGGAGCAVLTYSTKGKGNTAAVAATKVFFNGRVVGGRHTEKGTYMVRGQLKVGDVVALAAYSKAYKGNKAGVRAVLSVDDVEMSTGRGGWRVASLPKTLEWTRKGFSSCRWNQKVITGGWQLLFGTRAPSRALWSKSGNAAIRTVVGGESCPKPYGGGNGGPSYKAMISLTGDNAVVVFVNGVAVADTKSWREVAHTQVTVKAGDVIALRAKDGGLFFGVRISIKGGGKQLGSGVGDWRAASAAATKDEMWMKPGFDGCKWRKAEVLGSAGREVAMKASIKFDGSTKYIWAAGAEAGDGMVARMVVDRPCLV